MKKIIISAFALCFFIQNSYASNLDQYLRDYQVKLNAKIGVAVYDLNTEEIFSYNKNHRFPVMSTFKTFACAKMLYEVDHGNLDIHKQIRITEKNTDQSYTPVLKEYIGKSLNLKQLCDAVMMYSDNSATNIILRQVGGPKSLTAFMRSIGFGYININNYEPQVNTTQQYNIENTAKLDDMVKAIYKLLYLNVLTPESKVGLNFWMQENKVADGLLRSILPANYKIADRTGARKGSRAITAVITKKDMKPIIIAIYIDESSLDMKSLDKAINNIGQQIFESYNIE